MFHKAFGMEFKEGTTLQMTFQSGEIKAFDMTSLFGEYPQLAALKERKSSWRGGFLHIMAFAGQVAWTSKLKQSMRKGQN